MTGSPRAAVMCATRSRSISTPAHRQSYVDIVMVSIVGALTALAVVIVPGLLFGNF